MDSKHVGGNNKHSKTYAIPDGGHAFGSIILSLSDSCQENGSYKPPRMDPKTSTNVGTLAPAKKLRSSSYASSSDSLGEDLLQMNPKLIFKSSASTATISKPHEETLIRDVSSGTSSKSGGSGYTDITSVVSCLTHESTLQSMSPKRSPYIQVMERSGGYDPSRISSSVFACQSPTPIEWSVTSNESLFSLHIGNNSLSKDQVLPLSGELYKSGEMSKSSELTSLRLTPPTTVGGESERSMDAGNLTIGVGDEIMKNVPRGTANDHCEENIPSLEMSWNSSNTNRPLNVSSSKSFANPKKKKSSCYNCNWMFCCCTWPRCCCKWPSCRCKWPSYHCKWPSYCCKWPSCHCKWSSYCCKWSSCHCKWPSCCCKWPSCSFSSCSCTFCSCLNCRRKKICSCPPKSLTDGGTSCSAKGEPKQQHSQPPTSKLSKWFSCFSCSSCTCH